MNISGVVARSDSSYKGLNCSSSCRFLLFLKDRNASELVVSLFRDFRFSGQIALRDGILFDEVQIMARNAAFDFERRTDWVVIGCRLKYNLILLNVKTMAVAEAEQDYNPEDQETGDPVEVSADLCEFLQGEILDDQDGSSEYLVPDFFELDFKRLLDVLCSAGQGSYSNPDETFLQWMKKYELSAEVEKLFSWFMPTSEIMAGTGDLYDARDLMAMNDCWHRMVESGFLMIGSCANGDFIVINLKTVSLEVGYITHEEVDDSSSCRFQDKYIAISPTLGSFFHDSNLLWTMPGDYYHAKELGWSVKGRA